MATPQEAVASSPLGEQQQQLLRQVTMDTATTPSMLERRPQCNNAVPGPSPKSADAAFALSLLCQTQSVPSAATTSPEDVSVASSAGPSVSSAYSQQQQTLPPRSRPTPNYDPPAWHSHYMSMTESPFPVKRLKVSHHEVTKTSRFTHPAGMQPPPQQHHYVPSPYHPPPWNGSAQNHMPPFPQVRLWLSSFLRIVLFCIIISNTFYAADSHICSVSLSSPAS